MQTNIREMVNKRPASFINDHLVHMNDYLTDNGIYLGSHVDIFRGDVELDRVIGQAQGFGSLTYRDFVEGHDCNRVETTLAQLRSQTKYYTNNDPKQISFVQIGDVYFIDEGKQRTMTAKILAHYNPDHFGKPAILRNVLIKKQTIDNEYGQLVADINELKAAYPHLTFNMHYTRDQDAHCLTILQRNSMKLTAFYERREIKNVISAFRQPSLYRKLFNDKYHTHVPLAECLVKIPKLHFLKEAS